MWKGKDAVYYSGKSLEERTDEDHMLSTNQRVDLLQENYGISSRRTTTTTDIKFLKQYGLGIA